jgi:hypothetical protein
MWIRLLQSICGEQIYLLYLYRRPSPIDFSTILWSHIIQGSHNHRSTCSGSWTITFIHVHNLGRAASQIPNMRTNHSLLSNSGSIGSLFPNQQTQLSFLSIDLPPPSPYRRAGHFKPPCSSHMLGFLLCLIKCSRLHTSGWATTASHHRLLSQFWYHVKTNNGLHRWPMVFLSLWRLKKKHV